MTREPITTGTAWCIWSPWNGPVAFSCESRRLESIRVFLELMEAPNQPKDWSRLSAQETRLWREYKRRGFRCVRVKIEVEE